MVLGDDCVSRNCILGHLIIIAFHLLDKMNYQKEFVLHSVFSVF